MVQVNKSTSQKVLHYNYNLLTVTPYYLFCYIIFHQSQATYFWFVFYSDAKSMPVNAIYMQEEHCLI